MTDITSRLREWITIERKNLVDNGRGGRKRPDGEAEWLPVAADVAAEVIPLRGGEALTQSVVRNSQLYRVTIRVRDDVRPDHRLRWGSVTMNILTLPPSIDRATIVMTAESGATA